MQFYPRKSDQHTRGPGFDQRHYKKKPILAKSFCVQQFEVCLQMTSVLRYSSDLWHNNGY